jgi:hypothetical protein
VMWYLSPFACLYDLLQFGFGHLNGLDSSSVDAGRDTVVEARGAEADLAGFSVPGPAAPEARGTGLLGREPDGEPPGEKSRPGGTQPVELTRPSSGGGVEPAEREALKSP